MKLKINLILLFLTILFVNNSYAIPLDSLKVKKIDGQKFIMHKVEKGQGLLAIGRRYNMDVNIISEANNNKIDKLKVGDIIKIPIINSDTTKNDVSKTENIIVSVKEKSKTKQDIEPILKKNELEKIDDAHANADSKEKEKSKIYIVVSGDNLNKVAQRYKITPQLIIKWNGLRNKKIEVGQELIIDGSLVIKPFEKWNAINSVTSNQSSFTNILANSELVDENGFGTIGNDHAILHSSAPIGTLLLITNLDNGRQCFSKVTGNFRKDKTENILIIDDNTQRILNSSIPVVRLNIKYLNN